MNRHPIIATFFVLSAVLNYYAFNILAGVGSGLNAGGAGTNYTRHAVPLVPVWIVLALYYQIIIVGFASALSRNQNIKRICKKIALSCFAILPIVSFMSVYNRRVDLSETISMILFLSFWALIGPFILWVILHAYEKKEAEIVSAYNSRQSLRD